MKKSFLLLIATCLIACAISGCRKEDVSDCGCGVLNNHPQNLVGKIAYKVQTIPEDDFYNESFWISYSDGFTTSYIVCNEEMLPDEVLQLKDNAEQSLSINFSGESKELCKGKVDIPERFFFNIHLTKIKIE